jgi:hypothetical protein
MQAVLGEGAALILYAVHILPSSTAGGKERWKHDGRKREHSRCKRIKIPLGFLFLKGDLDQPG